MANTQTFTSLILRITLGILGCLCGKACCNASSEISAEGLAP